MPKEKPKRDKNGRLLPGNTANPNGRPKGISITEMVRAKLHELPPGEDKKTYGDMVVLAILKKALKDNDVPMLRALWAYMDGLPKQDVQIGADPDNPISIAVEFIKSKE